ncbi:hypothetical protein [Oceanithermus desulfurans]|uniref:Uncharacterized protein n=2 Tax=Oceanithermus desulfurans TaxID=227924 RepID=A0A511RLD6_9DEIN|nr:hypothetical protein [Oceanithermus desulfurans]MBB6029090.1 hypothetical protein [Oceanithermus desulfurans]GEM90481.1 hypothetical protein ODE01S_19150 [Oceanithermus desulfurans NBRC 100063]
MKIDDLLGILFLLFFIVGPALRGLLKPREPLVEVELPPELEEMMREVAPGKQEPPPQAARPKPAPAQTKPAQSARPSASSTPAPAAATGAPPGATQTAEGHAAGSRSRRRIEEARTDATDMAAEERAAFVQKGERPPHHRRAGVPLHRKGIVHGMLWHEILSEPVSKKRRRVRAKRRKLLS